MTRFPFSRQLAGLAAGVLCLCLAFVSPAGAEENNWTSSNSFDGSCVAPILCPTVTNAFVPVGGADGDGYLTSAFTGVVGVNAVAGTATGVWESPPFPYEGNSAARLVTLNRRASVDQLLAVEGNSAEYSVQLVDVSAGGSGPVVIGPATLAGADTWRPVPPASIKPVQLTQGDSYRIRITTRYTTGTSVLTTGTADYDNVGLTPATGSGTGAGGNGRGGGVGGAGSMSSDRLLSLFQSGMAGTAVLKGNRLFVRVSCPKAIRSSCRVTAQGLLRKHKPVTTKRTVKVGKGKRRLAVLRVKPRFRVKLAKRKRLLVSEKVRAGKATATAYKVRKLIRKR
jgi:hypothetical protein